MSTTCPAYLLPHAHVAFLCIFIYFHFPPNLPSFSVVCSCQIGHRTEFPCSNVRHEVTIRGCVKPTAGHLPCHLGFLGPRGCRLYSPCPSQQPSKHQLSKSGLALLSHKAPPSHPSQSTPSPSTPARYDIY